VTACAPASDLAMMPDHARHVEGFAIDGISNGARFIVVSTQGRGDEAALRAALAAPASYTAFVGSRAKVAALRERLVADGVAEARFDSLHAPAGLDIGAITPEEIALSILTEMIAHRRAGQRAEA